MDSLSSSPFVELVRSPFYDLQTIPPDLRLLGQQLTQIKSWPGLFRTWHANGETDDQINFRKHYDNMTVAYRYGAATYFATHYQTGPGHVPRMDGMPASIAYDGTFDWGVDNPTWLETPKPSLDYWWDRVLVGPSGVICSAKPGGINPAAFRWLSTFGPASEIEASFGWVGQIMAGDWENDPDTPIQTMDCTMVGDVPFGTHFEKMASRLIAREFPDFAVNREFNVVEPFNESFDEWRSGTIPLEDHYTGNPVATGERIRAVPFFFANRAVQTTIIPEDSLASYWYWPDYYYGGRLIFSGRTRFYVTKRTSLFIAVGMVTKNPLLGARDKSALSNVKLVYSGQAYKDSVVNIPFPTELDAGIFGFHDSLTDGMWGWVVFAILGESPEHWAARTGIPIG